MVEMKRRTDRRRCSKRRQTKTDIEEKLKKSKLDVCDHMQGSGTSAELDVGKDELAENSFWGWRLWEWWMAITTERWYKKNWIHGTSV